MPDYISCQINFCVSQKVKLKDKQTDISLCKHVFTIFSGNNHYSNTSKAFLSSKINKESKNFIFYFYFLFFLIQLLRIKKNLFSPNSTFTNLIFRVFREISFREYRCQQSRGLSFVKMAKKRVTFSPRKFVRIK